MTGAEPARAMVLAAGLGNRMQPLTALRAKPALPVAHRPLIQWTLALLARHDVRHVAINLHHLPDTVVAAVGDGAAFGLRVTWSRERTILGTGGGPRKLREFFGDGPAVLVNGDCLFDFDLGRLVEQHRAAGARATLALKPNPDPRRYPPVVTDLAGRVQWLRGFGRRRPGRHSLFTGVHVIDPAILDRLPAGPSDSVGDLYAGLLREGQPLLGVRTRGAWFDLGWPAAYLDAHRRLARRGLAGSAVRLVDPGARIDPAARVSGSFVGAGTSIGALAQVRRSVVWEGASIDEGAVVEECVVASGVRIPAGEVVQRGVLVPGPGGFRAHRL